MYKRQEYGHIHHKITDRLVTKICSEDGKEDRLFYFEKFFEKNEIPQNFKGNVNCSTLMKKHEMATLYTSQYKGCLLYTSFLWYWSLPMGDIPRE